MINKHLIINYVNFNLSYRHELLYKTYKIYNDVNDNIYYDNYYINRELGKGILPLFIVFLDDCWTVDFKFIKL